LVYTSTACFRRLKVRGTGGIVSNLKIAGAAAASFGGGRCALGNNEGIGMGA